MRQDPARGFTLIELVVVIAIIGVIAVAVVPTAFTATERAKVSATLLDFQAVKTGAMNYFNDVAAWPADAAASVGFVTTDSASGWEGPYLERWPAKAKWGAGTNTFNNDSVYDWDGVAGLDAARYLEITLVPDASAITLDTKLDPTVSETLGGVRHGASGAGATTTVRILIQTAVAVAY